jgi:hypothetical protein
MFTINNPEYQTSDTLADSRLLPARWILDAGPLLSVRSVIPQAGRQERTETAGVDVFPDLFPPTAANDLVRARAAIWISAAIDATLSGVISWTVPEILMVRVYFKIISGMRLSQLVPSAERGDHNSTACLPGIDLTTPINCLHDGEKVTPDGVSIERKRHYLVCSSAAGTHERQQ